MKKVIAIITAAGSGSRMRSGTKKQYLKIAGKPILARTLLKFNDLNRIDDIIVVCPKDDINYVRTEIVEKYDIGKVRSIVAGGKLRQDSVYNALKDINCRFDDIVMVHDGVRPFVSDLSIISSIEAAIEFGGAVVGVKPKNTIKSLTANTISKTLVREELFSVQTPQTFLYDILKKSYEKAIEEKFVSTDDSSLVEKYADFVEICPVEGDYFNIKITTKEDLVFAEAILKAKS